MKSLEFKGTFDRPAVKGKGIVSEAQRQYLHSKDPLLAQHMERFSDPTAFVPLRAAPRRKRK